MSDERKNEIRAQFPVWAALCDLVGWPEIKEGEG